MGKLSITTERLEEIKEFERNKGMAMSQGHDKASSETLAMFSGLKELLDDRFKNLENLLRLHAEQNNKDNAAILQQTTKTNGRVNKLEKWRAILTGAWIVITAILTASWSIISSIIKNGLLK